MVVEERLLDGPSYISFVHLPNNVAKNYGKVCKYYIRQCSLLIFFAVG